MDRRPERTLDETRLQHLRRRTRLGDDAPRGVTFLGAIGILLVALAAAWLLQRYVAASSIGMVFLTAVLVTAITYGLWPSLFVALLNLQQFVLLSFARMIMQTLTLMRVLFIPPFIVLVKMDMIMQFT